ncbi:MAG: uroporphyrinogen-III C-methyltransferase, partial [Dehalococcoidia bacterium]|nr:uroporphyrinogen-III C-methyltransferase [Dehalococcoidia bacterium]
MTKSFVSLVGAGPGDPGLISVKGLRLLRSADVIVYDRLVDKRLLSDARADAELTDVGKIPGKRINRQEDINNLLVSLGKAGKRVVRLKGGDPFVFGRGGEEAEALAEAGVSFEIVPGITSAIAAPAYAGIPLTHRRLASSFTVVTGSEDPTKPDSAVDWQALAKVSDTLVILMGQSNLRSIVEALMQHGRSASTPVALVQWGTEPYQRTLVATLSDVVEKAVANGIGAPAVTIVGEVARLRDTIRWFDNRPLFGKRVLVTRTRTQAGALSEMLTQRGAQPIELPTIEIQQIDDFSELDMALTSGSEYDWIIFASTNAVDVVFNRMAAIGLDARALHGVQIAAIGPATKRRIRDKGIIADFTPSTFVAESVADELSALGMDGRRVLLPQAEIARDVLRTGLAEQGAV